MDERYCQSCGMPMGNLEDLYGSEKNGAKSKDYCKYCYENGEFTYDCTMDEMIKICIPHMVSANENMSEDEAYDIMKEFLPTLKRWQD